MFYLLTTVYQLHLSMVLNKARFNYYAADESTMLLLLLSHFNRVQLCDPIDGSPPGSAVPGILQARTLEWVAISFSNAWKWKVKVKSLSCVQLSAAPWTAAHQAPPSTGVSGQEYWSGVPLPSPKSTILPAKLGLPFLHFYNLNIIILILEKKNS